MPSEKLQKQLDDVKKDAKEISELFYEEPEETEDR